MILDTNAVTAILTGDRAIGHAMAGVDQCHLPLPVVAEMECGLLGHSKPKRLEALFRRLETDSVLLLPDRETATWYASIKHSLKLRGKPIPVNDVWIAALSRQYSLPILSRDGHFDAVDEIERVSW